MHVSSAAIDQSVDSFYDRSLDLCEEKHDASNQ